MTDQNGRLAELLSYDILDTPEESDFNEIVALASQICDAPISLVSLVDTDRQWFKAKVGLKDEETGLDSICALAIQNDEILVIGDTLADARTVDNPLVYNEVGLRFYAGAPLKNAAGVALGTLCVLDTKPRDLSDEQKFALSVLSKQVMTQLDLRRTLRKEKAAFDLAAEREEALQHALAQQKVLNQEIDHRVKNSLQLVSTFLSLQRSRSTDKEVRSALSEAQSRVLAIASIHADLHRSSDADMVDMPAYLSNLATDLAETTPNGIKVDVACAPMRVSTRKATSIAIIVNEFVTNSIKYAFPGDGGGTIRIKLEHADGRLRLDCADDGVGYAGNPKSLPAKGLGMRIIDASARQINGEMQFMSPEAGTLMRVEFDA